MGGSLSLKARTVPSFTEVPHRAVAPRGSSVSRRLPEIVLEPVPNRSNNNDRKSDSIGNLIMNPLACRRNEKWLALKRA
jgi:hypothetical protein